MKKKEIFDICDQLGIVHEKQDGFQNESLLLLTISGKIISSI